MLPLERERAASSPEKGFLTMDAVAESTSGQAEASREESQEGKIEEGDEDDAVVARAQRLMSKIVDARENPSPRHIHALATLMEFQETRRVNCSLF